MDVLVLIDKLDDTVHNAKPVPLTDQVRVDKEEIYDILDQMRATIPEEIKQARWIVKERQEMLAEAKREAERVDDLARCVDAVRRVRELLLDAADLLERAHRLLHLGAQRGRVEPVGLAARHERPGPGQPVGELERRRPVLRVVDDE